MYDIIESIYGSTVQHGKHNDRLYVMRLDTAQEDKLLVELDRRADEYGYGKIFAKVPAGSRRKFESAGYIPEAVIPRFFSGRTDCCFLGKFFSDRLRCNEDFKGLSRLIEAKAIPKHTIEGMGPVVERCSERDAGQLAHCYRKAFQSYPFPVFDGGYLARMMSENVAYYCIREAGSIRAVAATESDVEGRYAEMTDFVTVEECRGKGYASALLRRMESELEEAGIITAYTIARAASLGMNTVFKNGGYTYAGLLIHNTQISGRIESMTVWYKRLVP